MSMPVLTLTSATPSTNPYEGGRMMTTVNCPVCECRVHVSVDDVDAILRGIIVVMHTTSEHWTRVYWGSDPARVQYAPMGA